MKVFCAEFRGLQFRFVILQHKDFGAKTASKMLVKSATGFNFINILQTALANKNVFRSVSWLIVWVCNFFVEIISVQKQLVN